VVSPAFLLDTNIISEPTKPKPNAAFLERFEVEADRIAVSAVTWHEALYGARSMPDGKRKRAVLEYLRALAAPVLPYDMNAAEWFADERARLRKRGKPVPHADGQIAAIAAVNDLVLVTANVRDFAAFEGLRVESWMRPAPR
jgi:tRNA(fMet)-specific endonuclease VapC